MDAMEPKMQQGGVIVEHHDPTMFPERWFSLVIVLRCTTESIFDRLSQRFDCSVTQSVSFFCSEVTVLRKSLKMLNQKS